MEQTEISIRSICSIEEPMAIIRYAVLELKWEMLSVLKVRR